MIPESRVSAGKQRAFGKVARFVQIQSGSPLRKFCKRAWSEVLMENATKSEYDLYSAVTFFLVGLGVGSVLALVFNPRHRVELEAINSWQRAA